MLTFRKEHIPNLISCFRILLVPFYVLFFFGILGNEERNSYFIAGTIFILAGVSDAIDGFLARHFHWVSNIGKLLDPFADKLLEVVVTVCLAIEFGGPFVTLSAIIIAKEIIMMVGAYLIMTKNNVYVSSVWCGKLATIVWYLLICVCHLFPNVARGDMLLANMLCIFLIFVMIMAFVIYVYNYAAQIKSTKDAIVKRKK